MRKHNNRKRISRKKQQVQGEQLEQRQLLASDLTVLGDSFLNEVRSIDGTDNNLIDPTLGSTETTFVRIADSEYSDGVSEAAGEDRPSARKVSNSVVAQDGSVVNDRFLTDFVWQWGQFIDHDIDLTNEAYPSESLNISVPTGDVFFDPMSSGTQVISLNRSEYDPATGSSRESPREQINSITAYIDGSVVYGSDDVRAAALRTFDGGRLKTSDGDLLPFNVDGFDNAGGTTASLFLAGDVRANEQVGLTSLQTLFVREHNRLADEISAVNSDLSDEEIYQQARAIVTAEIQSITFNEFLPALLGPDAIAAYQGYDPTVDPRISNEFATAAYRFGHSMLSSEILRLNNDGTIADEGSLSLREMFFAPQEVIDNGIDSLLLGLASQQAQEIDNLLVDDVRNFLFGPPGAGGFDLASLNIQRGRDHGLADYNATRIALGLAPVTSFDQISSDSSVVAALETTYDSVDDIDLWVGGLAEDHVDGGSMGELFTTIVADQFTRLRDGDRFWYQNVFHGRQLDEIETSMLSDIIVRNTGITSIQENVFFDASVWIHNTNDGRSELTWITGNGDDVTIREAARRGSNTETHSASEMSQIQVTGQDGDRDIIVLNLSQLDTTVSGGFVIQGQAGHGDVLVLATNTGANLIVVGDGTIQWNDQIITFTGIERIVIFSADSSDSIEVDASVEVRIDTLSEETPTNDRVLLNAIDRSAPRPDRPRLGIPRPGQDAPQPPRDRPQDGPRSNDTRRQEENYRRAVDHMLTDFS